MGIFSFFKKAPDTKTLLANIQSEIETIDEYKYSVSRKQKNYIGVLLISSGLLYVIGALICYFVYLPKSQRWIEKILYSLPLVVFPIIVWALKRALQWYYRWVIDSKDERLSQLKKEKKKILEKVKETETFKDAKEILEKYDPNALFELTKRNPDVMNTPRMNQTPQMMSNASGSQMRYRGGINMNMNTPMTPVNRMPMNRTSMGQVAATPGMPMTRTGQQQQQQQPTPRLALMAPPNFQPVQVHTSRPILPSNRSMMEKMVDYVVGDGPNNRYALICNVCHSHNGMALKEEFEYIAYKCAYCARFNPPRKIRPLAPRLNSGRPSLAPLIDEPESDTDSNKGVATAKNDSESTSKLTIEEIMSQSQSQSGDDNKETRDDTKDSKESCDEEKNESVEEESREEDSGRAEQVEEASLSNVERERRESDDSFDMLLNPNETNNDKQEEEKKGDDEIKS